MSRSRQLPLRCALVIAVEEQPISLDRPLDVATKLVLISLFLVLLGEDFWVRLEIVAGRKVLVSMELVGVAMKAIGTGFDLQH